MAVKHSVLFRQSLPPALKAVQQTQVNAPFRRMYLPLDFHSLGRPGSKSANVLWTETRLRLVAKYSERACSATDSVLQPVQVMTWMLASLQ